MPSKVSVSARLDGTKLVRDFVNVFRTQTVDIAVDEMASAAEKLALKVRKGLLKQTFKHRPLSERYLQKKRVSGLDTRVLIATQAYVNAIGVEQRQRKGEIVSYAVGVPRGIHKPSGLTYQVLARIHEFGSVRRGIPARPHWRPAWSRFLREDAGMVVKRVKLKSDRLWRYKSE